MKSKKTKPLPARNLRRHARDQIKKRQNSEHINFAGLIRDLRKRRGLSGVDLCRRAGDLDPKTLTAVEKGRIKNPSIKTMLSLSRGLGITVADLFREPDLAMERNLIKGSQKGAFQLEFKRQGVKLVSFTPFMRDFFCGKLILAPRKRLQQDLLSHGAPFFVTPLIGRFEIQVGGEVLELKEGENLFFNGVLEYSFFNPLHRESVLLMVTAPSFV